MANYKRRIPHKKGRHRCGCCGRTARNSEPNRKILRMDARTRDEHHLVK